MIEHAPVLPGAIEFAYSRLSEGEPEYIARSYSATCIAAQRALFEPLFVDARPQWLHRSKLLETSIVLVPPEQRRIEIPIAAMALDAYFLFRLEHGISHWVRVTSTA